MRLFLKKIVRFFDLGKGPSHFQIVQPQVKRRIARLFNDFCQFALTKFATRQMEQLVVVDVEKPIKARRSSSSDGVVHVALLHGDHIHGPRALLVAQRRQREDLPLQVQGFEPLLYFEEEWRRRRDALGLLLRFHDRRVVDVQVDRIHTKFDMVRRPPAQDVDAGRGAGRRGDGAARLIRARRVGGGGGGFRGGLHGFASPAGAVDSFPLAGGAAQRCRFAMRASRAAARLASVPFRRREARVPGLPQR
mmetsp:Transcript_16374/g.46398  ORF Transcript_16374/g.46398 Transcript_16374/m.46398 type:complete len:249 (+) Transcript_16374:1027-1773(+)